MFLFSQRERARRAAIAAHERYPEECAAWLTRGEGCVPEYWGYVINAALRAVESKGAAEPGWDGNGAPV